MQQPTKRGNYWGLLIKGTWIRYETHEEALNQSKLFDLEKKKRKLHKEINAIEQTGDAQAKAPLDAAVDSYINSLRANNNKKGYIHKVRIWLKPLLYGSDIKSVSDISPLAMTTSLGKMGDTTAGKVNYVKVTKTFLRWCQNQGIKINENCLKVKKPKVPKTERRLLTDDEKTRIVEASRELDKTNRLTVAIQFLFAFGPRPSEFTASIIKELNQKSTEFSISALNAKTGDSRTFPIGDKWVKLLKDTYQIDKREGIDALFINSHNNPFNWTYLSNKFYDACELAKIDDLPSITLYLTRHYAASTIAMKTHDMTVVKNILGHSIRLSNAVYQHRHLDVMKGIADGLF